jgi:DNA-binding XRE family transcriptional regulator
MRRILVASCLLCSFRVYASPVFYGFVKASVINASNAVNSFNNVNMSAPTSASNKSSITDGKSSRSTFQVAQSRFGLNVEVSKQAIANIEMDFVDFSQSSPTTSSRPRLRTAFVDYYFNKDFFMRIGQDWDTFLGQTPINFNYIANYFNAGNVGFMKNQLKLIKLKDDWEYNFTIAQASKSSSNQDTELEKESSVSFSGYIQKDINGHVINLSAISSEVMINGVKEQASGLGFAFSKSGGFVDVRMEFYTGKGLSHLALLSLPTSKFVKEYGGYLTTKFTFDSFNVYLGAGFAKNEDDASSAFDNNAGKFTTMGANKNQVVKMGISKTLNKTQFFTEFSRFETTYLNDKSDATVLEAGVVLKF